ncbi:Glutamate receptor ionotropic, kainate 1 [Frankliniella fusca]|uniref:Glutamate receptor ionotropic, kainate 1 n=1 Tax=Frankliniella fusca TaxID=407009 RepID=A0AAE1LIE9_9NEOP|nr:Glutamate receptor ionotropic, kainate 1 [Frankliniella fusca]
MTTVFLFALLLAGTPGVLAAVPVPVAPFANEAASALQLLLPSILTQNSTLLIYGSANWTGSFVHALPPTVARTLLPDAARFWERRFNHRTMTGNRVFLVVAESPADPHRLLKKYLNYERTLFWFRGGGFDAVTLANVTPYTLCGRPTAFAVTVPNGSSTVYAVTAEDCYGLLTPQFRAEDHWSPATRRWQHGGTLLTNFRPFCSNWRPPPAGEPLCVLEQTSGMQSPVSKLVQALKQGLSGVPWKTELFTLSSWNSIDRLIRECRLDAFLSEGGVPDFSGSGNEFQLPDRSLHHIMAIVPAGLGPVVNPLSAVALEFSPAVWCGTALAALGTAAALACTLRRDRGAALLLALAPLLAQSPPPAPPPPGLTLRPLLGVWLLVCVVLAAAYQGLLLGMLSTARPRGEIDSLQALKDSGLSIHLTWGILRCMQGSKLLAELMERGSLLLPSDLPDFLLNMALHKNSAAILLHDRNLQRLVNTISIPDGKLHTFPLGLQYIKNIAWATHGSPLAGPITTTFRRLEAGGLLEHWENVMDEPGRRARARHLVSLPLAAPLTVDNMKPAFVVLAAGLALAGLVLAAELVVAWSGRAKRRAGPGHRHRLARRRGGNNSEFWRASTVNFSKIFMNL